MNKQLFIWHSLLLLWLLALTNAVGYAQDKKVLSRTGQVPIGRFVDYLEDKEQKLSIREVVSAQYADKFIRSDKDILNFGFTNSVYWVRFEIDGSYRPVEQEYILEINYPLIDQLTIYRQDEFGAWSEDTEGDKFPFKDREIAHRNIAHKIVIPPRKVSTFYLRFQTQGSMQIPIIIWKPHDFYNQAFNENMIFGILYGTLFVVVAYNIFLFWIVQKWLHLAFAGMILLSIFFLATQDGYAFKYLWTDGNEWANYTLPISTGLLTCASCVYL
ncbi:MAG: 7TM-DISM domain-containing protein, partial [Thermoflexibacteraceae bacterium]